MANISKPAMNTHHVIKLNCNHITIIRDYVLLPMCCCKLQNANTLQYNQ